MYIHALPVSKKYVPPALRNPVNLIRDIRTIVNSHKEDTVEQATTGKQLLFWPGVRDDKVHSVDLQFVSVVQFKSIQSTFKKVDWIDFFD